MVRCECGVIYEGTDGEFAEHLADSFNRRGHRHEVELLEGWLRPVHALVR